MKTFAALLLCFAPALPQGPSDRGFTPKDGFVPTQAVALAIAEAVLIPVYGKSVVDSERPFKATLKNSVWTITGTLHCVPPDSPCPGGTAELRISKRTGQILFMTHYQ